MIVYGDPAYDEDIPALVERLELCIQHIARTSPGKNENNRINPVRDLLIQCGELEQAVADCVDGTPAKEAAVHYLRAIQAVTDHAAHVFVDEYLCRNKDEIGKIFKVMVRELAGLSTLRMRTKVKVPEGFAFYALYPEQYIRAALSWSEEHAEAEPKSATVVGIRSIGTTLSAVVNASLETAGWQVHRMTVRPGGHPLARNLNHEKLDIRDAKYALVVDEGPGISGSSMASVGDALVRAGTQSECISFLPGHDAVPQSTTIKVANWWSGTPRYVIPRNELRWRNRSLLEVLAESTQTLCGPDDGVELIEDISNGLWRRIAYADAAQWPAVSVRFEQLKYLVTLRSGIRILWKFVSLAGGADGNRRFAAVFDRLNARARDGWTSGPIAGDHGFIAMPWIDGTRLTHCDGHEDTLTHIGSYIAAVAESALTRPERQASLARLQEMLYWNTKELLGDSAAASTQIFCDTYGEEVAGKDLLPSYGDGRMAPHEWIRSPVGEIFKLDAAGHEMDHTTIGRQSMAWDIAGTIVEWNLDKLSTAHLLCAVKAANGASFSARELTFYTAAYAAFRAGQCMMCMPAPDEGIRLESALTEYRNKLNHLITSL